MQLQPDEPEVKKCHLHKKANKACKFCKAYILWAEQQEKKKEEAKNEILESGLLINRVNVDADSSSDDNFSDSCNILR